MFKVFEISSANGLISDYALCRARGEGGKPDPKLKALLADHAQRLKEKQEMAKLESSANSKSQLTEAKPPATGRSVKNMDSVIIESTAIEVVKEMSLKCNLVYAFQERELIDSKAWLIKFYMEDEDVQQTRIQVDATTDRVSLKETIKRELSNRFSSV